MLRLSLSRAARSIAIGLFIASPTLTRAQESTQDRLERAKALYEQFNIEAARPILLNIISPSYIQQVSAEHKAIAYKYLGASYAVLANPDSARLFFIGALDFDPFTDLDPTKFAASELASFNLAKSQIFKLAIKPVGTPSLVVPRITGDSSGSYVFRLITLQRASPLVV